MDTPVDERTAPASAIEPVTDSTAATAPADARQPEADQLTATSSLTEPSALVAAAEAASAPAADVAVPGVVDAEGPAATATVGAAAATAADQATTSDAAQAPTPAPNAVASTKPVDDVAAVPPLEAAAPQTPANGFASLGLGAEIVAAVVGLGYEEPTDIQSAAIPPLLAGRDVLGQAATGTGKTAAFALPMLQRLASAPRDPNAVPRVRALVLVPTRELAMQVAEATHKFGRGLDLRVLPIFGGQSIGQQLRALSRGVDLVVATPGRAIDHLQRGTLNLEAVEIVVLDEADEMLDMGFADELEAILKDVPAQRQTALFSATMAPRILSIAKRHLSDPARITIAREQTAAGEAPRVREVAYLTQRRYKVAALGRVLDMEAPTSAIIFCRTRTEVDELGSTLGGRGYQAETLHGGLSQEQRDRVMRRFRDGTSDVLVATDVAARGLDIEHLSHVVNFDVPPSPDAYIHRVGRTGRAGREGVAITLLDARERRLLQNIEHVTKRRIAIESVPTVHDLRQRRIELTRAALEESLAAGGFEAYRGVVESLAADHDPLDIAAAAMRLADSPKDSAVDEVEIPVLKPMPVTFIAQGGGTGAAGGERRESRPFRPRFAGGEQSAADVARVYVGAGRNAGIGPKDLVGAIANEAQIHSSSIGSIEIADRYSLVEVPSEVIDKVVTALRATTLRGKRPEIRRDNGPGDR